MQTYSPKRITLLLGDLLVFAAALALGLVIRHGGAPDPTIVALYRFAGPFLAALWLAGFVMFGLYDSRIAKNDPLFFERLLKALLLNFAVTVLLFYAIPEFGLRPLVALVIIFAILALLSSLWRGAFNYALARRTKERALFFGVTEETMELVRFLRQNPQLGFTPVALFAAAADAANGMAETDGLAVFHDVSQLRAAAERENISRVIIAHHVEKTPRLFKNLFPLITLGITTSDFARFYESVRGKIPVSLISESWFIENLIGQRRPRYEFLKRITDLLFALIAGVLALLFLPAIAVLILAATPREAWHWRRYRARPGDGLIFFRQRRTGRDGRAFEFVKFRSQRLGAELMGGEKTAAGENGSDPRSYGVGTFLRKTYLDELPQLWNVIKGDMSFVGPRPERPEFVEELEREIPFYRMRELVLPGITGWAQINMENDASVSDAPEKMQYDLFYIKNRSLFFDLSIMIRTLVKLLGRSGR